MGFCGCTLYASTTTAVVFGIIFSVFGCTWTGYLCFERGSGVENITDWENATSFTYFRKLHDGALEAARNDEATKYLVINYFAIHALWFLCSMLLIVGNSAKIPWILYLWVVVTAFVVLSDTAATSYYIYKATDIFLNNPPSNGMEFYRLFESCLNAFSYVLLAVLAHKGFLIIFCLSITLAVYVVHRAREISKSNKLEKSKKHNQKHYQEKSQQNIRRYDYSKRPAPSPLSYSTKLDMGSAHTSPYNKRETAEMYPLEHRYSSYTGSRMQRSPIPVFKNPLRRAERESSPVHYPNRQYSKRFEYDGTRNEPEPDYGENVDYNYRGARHRY